MHAGNLYFIISNNWNLFFVFDLTPSFQEENKKEFTEKSLPVKLRQWENFLGESSWLAGANVSVM